jgi:hypothetical protein
VHRNCCSALIIFLVIALCYFSYFIFVLAISPKLHCSQGDTYDSRSSSYCLFHKIFHFFSENTSLYGNSNPAMYEGKNIHYSPSSDQKPLCSFSGKICNQRRLNHFGFCVRHILEDPTAPFKRCAYVAKSSRQTCTQPIPKNEDRE